MHEVDFGAFGERRQMVILCGTAQPREAKSLTTVSFQLFLYITYVCVGFDLVHISQGKDV